MSHLSRTPSYRPADTSSLVLETTVGGLSPPAAGGPDDLFAAVYTAWLRPPGPGEPPAGRSATCKVPFERSKS